MEFLSGYAAARAPFTVYQVEPHQQRERSSKPQRSNSTAGAPSKKRSRIHGHIRTSSASTSGSTRAEIRSALQQHAGFDSSAGAAPAASRATSSVQHHNSPRLDQQRERMPASVKYYQDKQLPATPRLDTREAASKYLGAGSASEPASARTPASLSANTPTAYRLPASATTPTAPAHPATASGNVSCSRAESVSSISGATTVSSRTMLSSEPPSSAEVAAHNLRPFVVRNGRTYISDPTLPYPLPVDLEELHRQTLRTLLLMQLFGGPICSPSFAHKPPTRILEVGCGSGFWSQMCYKYYEQQGHNAGAISFTGLDIAPVAPGASGHGTTTTSSSGAGSRMSSSSAAAGLSPIKDMKWRFVQHDLRRLPWPFPDGEFDLVMVKDMSLATTTAMQQTVIDEYLRILAPGGTIEIWESDHTLRMLRPHVPDSAAAVAPATAASSRSSATSSEQDEQTAAANMGAYLMTANTPLSAPLNNYLVEYNGWLQKALEARSLTPVPCTLVASVLLQEAETLASVESKRLAIPLSEVRWEREGVGGVVTKDGKSYIRAGVLGKGGKESAAALPTGKALDPAAAALRRTALLTVAQMIQSMESVLREVSGKSQDEWDSWCGKMMNDLVKENGTSWGECLEVGAWWARKR
ncbi:hypothetical protein QBC46DRAFT_297338, partial [Diplogelasinospora grovesii]